LRRINDGCVEEIEVEDEDEDGQRQRQRCEPPDTELSAYEEEGRGLLLLRWDYYHDHPADERTVLIFERRS